MLLLVRVVLLSLFDEFMLLLLRLLLSFALLVFVLLLLLSLFDEFMLLLVRVVLLSLFDEFMLLLLPLSVDVLVVVMLRFDVTVLPPRAVMSSAADALSEKASEMAVTSKVLFIRFPLWVLVGDRSAVAPTLLSIAQPMPAT
jgi:hypothetical protein